MGRAAPPAPRHSNHGDRRFLLPDPGHESRSRVRHARDGATRLALGRRAALCLCRGRAGDPGHATASRRRQGWGPRDRHDLRRRRRPPDPSGTLRRRGGLPRLLLARVALARLQRRRLRHQRGRGAARAQDADGLAAPGMTGKAARHVAATVAAGEAGQRLDVWLASRLPELSRSRIKVLIDEGHVEVDGADRKASHRLKPGERVRALVPPPPGDEMAAEAIPLRVVFEDAHVLVVDKPAGMVTHPGAGRMTGTLAAAALAHAPEISGVGGPRRPGIVHRLDKGTSGLIVLAKTRAAYDSLTAQLARRTVSRRYLCLAHGVIRRDEGVIEAPIGRDPRSRVRMAVARAGTGKRALTRYRILERLTGVTYLECRLETGRTHQIRVHLASIGHPLVGDTTYGSRKGRDVLPPKLVEGLGGVALHAAGLSFLHPATGELIELASPLPNRIGVLLSHLSSTCRRHVDRGRDG